MNYTRILLLEKCPQGKISNENLFLSLAYDFDELYPLSRLFEKYKKYKNLLQTTKKDKMFVIELIGELTLKTKIKISKNNIAEVSLFDANQYQNIIKNYI